MGKDSAIEWTDATFNPVWGCIKVSPGCEHCYAMTWANRYGFDVWGPAKTTGRRTFGDKHWAEPLKWNKEAERAGQRKRVFCSSMADVFEDHPVYETERPRLWRLIEATPMLDWLLLTKRPENIARMMPVRWGCDPERGYFDDSSLMPPNVWIGTSVEDQQRANARIPHLLRVPARVRFLSCEPLLGPVDVSRLLVATPCWHCGNLDGESGRCYCGVYISPEIHWVIVGGESGHGARPMRPDWARLLRDQAQAAGVAFHFKQWGEYEPYEEAAQAPFWEDRHGRMHDGHALDVLNPLSGEVNPGWHEDSIHSPYIFRRVGKKAAGRLLDGREWNEFPVDTSPAQVYTPNSSELYERR